MPERQKQLKALLIAIIVLLAVVVVLLIKLSASGGPHAAPPNALLNMPLPPVADAEPETTIPEAGAALNAAEPQPDDEEASPQEKPTAPEANAIEAPRTRAQAPAPKTPAKPEATAPALTEQDLEGVPDEFRPSQSTALEAALAGHEDWVGKVRSHSADWARATVWIGPPASEYVLQLEVTWNLKGQYYDITGRKTLGGQ